MGGHACSDPNCFKCTGTGGSVAPNYVLHTVTTLTGPDGNILWCSHCKKRVDNQSHERIEDKETE